MLLISYVDFSVGICRAWYAGSHHGIKVSGICICICICMLRRSTHYCAIAPRVLSHHIVDFSDSRRMETAPMFIEVLLRPNLGQSDEPSDLRSSLSPTTQHRCIQHMVCARRSSIQLWTGAGVA